MRRMLRRFRWRLRERFETQVLDLMADEYIRRLMEVLPEDQVVDLTKTRDEAVRAVAKETDIPPQTMTKDP